MQKLEAEKKEIESKRATLRTSEQSIVSKINTAREKIVLSKKSIIGGYMFRAIYLDFYSERKK